MGGHSLYLYLARSVYPLTICHVTLMAQCVAFSLLLSIVRPRERAEKHQDCPPPSHQDEPGRSFPCYSNADLSIYLSIYLSQCRRHTMLEASGASLHFLHKRLKGTQSAHRIASSREKHHHLQKPVPAPYHTNRALNQHVAYLPTYLSRLLLPPFSTFLTSYQLRDPCQDYRSLS